MNENLTSKICPNCGAVNTPTTNFCINCGAALQTNAQAAAQPQAVIQPQTEIQPQAVIQPQTVETPQVNQFEGQAFSSQVAPATESVSPMAMNMQPQAFNNQVNAAAPQNGIQTGKMNYFKYIIQVLIRPFSEYKDHEEINETKHAAIMSLILVVILTLLRLLNSIVSAVKVTSFFSGETEWVWENLENVEFFDVISKGFLTYAGILLAIAAVYFIANSIIKKGAKFSEVLAGSATAYVPFVAGSVLSLIVGLFSMTGALIFMVIGIVYSLVMLVELMNDIINIEDKNTRIILHSICLSILVIGGGYIAYKILLSTITSGLGSLGGSLGGLGSLGGFLK